MSKEKLRDIQSEPDDRKLAIDKVGVKNITYPVSVMDKSAGEQHTVATVNMFVDLPHHFRGTHMSRFVSILNKYRKEISTRNIREILEDMKDSLNAQRAHFEMEFPFFMNKSAPVTGEVAKMDYICRLSGDSSIPGYLLEVRVPVQSVCPCSKEISAYGAHNQRSFITIAIRAESIIWIEDVIKIAESSASSEVFPLLKREDEKFVTEYGYDHPMFVEDMVRSAAEALQDLDGVSWFSVESENLESIHNHSAFARIEKKVK